MNNTKKGILFLFFTLSTFYLSARENSSYILTPKPGAAPRINGTKVFGVRPHSPVLYKIAATGNKPITYEVKNLPEGLSVDSKTGVIMGKLWKEGEYKMQLIVTNNVGKAERLFTIKVGSTIALTPPMGWNSWNCWGIHVTQQKVISSAQAMIDKGLIDHGWTYVNVDDAWSANERLLDGSITGNANFPDMNELGNWLHSRGLKFGIYSSPGFMTCGNFPGSYHNELQDATTFAMWGVDYLKYDWCHYNDIFTLQKDSSLAAYIKPYEVMRQALRSQPRDIVYSLCQYGMKDVWKWGEQVDGNCWRMKGDIVGTWESLKVQTFSLTDTWPYAKPGRWNDPDMMIIGNIGVGGDFTERWGRELHPTALTPDEQFTHVSIYCLLSAPLLLGCDLASLDDFTLSLITNDEVIDVNQDPLGKQARQIFKNETYQLWCKEMEDGSKALGIFNLSDKKQEISVNWSELNLKGGKVRDLWRQKDLGKFPETFKTKVNPHGVVLIRVQ